MGMFEEFEKGFDEGYGQGFKKGYIQAIDEFQEGTLSIEDEIENEKIYGSRPDYCPMFTPAEELKEMVCMNCPIEDKCSWNKSNEVYSGEDFFGTGDLDLPDLDDTDFDDDEDYRIELLYDTEQIQKIQEIIEEVSMISAHIGTLRSGYFQDKDTIDVLDSIRENVHNAIERLRELQEEAAIDEMYEFLVKNY